MDIILSDTLKKIKDEKFNNELQYQLNQFLADSNHIVFHLYDSEFLPLSILMILHITGFVIITAEEITTDEIQPTKKNGGRYL